VQNPFDIRNETAFLATFEEYLLSQSKNDLALGGKDLNAVVRVLFEAQARKPQAFIVLQRVFAETIGIKPYANYFKVMKGVGRDKNRANLQLSLVDTLREASSRQTDRKCAASSSQKEKSTAPQNPQEEDRQLTNSIFTDLFEPPAPLGERRRSLFSKIFRRTATVPQP